MIIINIIYFILVWYKKVNEYIKKIKNENEKINKKSNRQRKISTENSKFGQSFCNTEDSRGDLTMRKLEKPLGRPILSPKATFL